MANINLLSIPRKNSVIFKLLVLFLFAALFNVSCGKKKKGPGESLMYTEDTARIISHVTTGIISSGDKIYLRFVDPVEKGKKTGTKVNEDLFSFKPGIRGSAVWEDPRTIAFIPEKKLPFHEEYSGTADFSGIDPLFKKMPPIRFSFRVSGRELEGVTGDFEILRDNDPDLLVYRGEIVFTEDLAFDKVKSNVRFFSSTSDISLLWSEKSSGRKFVFSSGTVSRKKGGEDYFLKVTKKGTEISEDVVRKIRLEPLSEFKVIDVVKFDKGQKPGIEIKFSQKLRTDQDMRGLVSIEPSMPSSLKSLDKSIYVESDFKFGEQYTVTIQGVRSKWGGKIEKVIRRSVSFEDRKPEISFSSDGVFLPTSQNRKIGFRTMNVKNVHVTIKRVFESNLGQFLQSESLSGEKSRSSDFGYYEMSRVGVKVAEKALVIGDIKNSWLNHELDMKELIKEKDRGIFVVELSFKREDMLYSGLKAQAGYYYGNDYYSNPNSHGYIYRHGNIFKPVIVSDIGLTYKKGGGEHFVFASNLIDSSPMSGVRVRLRTFQNQVVSEGETDGDGKIFFRGVKEEVFFVEAEKDGQKSLVKPSEMSWNLSSFDTGGVVSEAEGTRAFIYTERGVYRPGDPINLSVIARNGDGTFPKNHPVVLELYNPRNQMVKKNVLNTGEDGFFNFPIITSVDDPTGNWRAKLTLGSTHFFHTLKIETVVPFRLKVRLDPDRDRIGPSDRSVKLSLSSSYLFGAPSPFLDADISVSLRNNPKNFKKFSGFFFSNETRSFTDFNTTVFEGKLDAEGKAEIVWKLPELSNVPSSLRAEIKASVLEKGGRATKGDAVLPVDPYKNYIGLEMPKLKYGYSTVGSPVRINSILVNKDGEPVSGRTIRYRVYSNARYWWWEYDNLSSFRVRYKNDNYTKVVSEGTFTSKNIPVAIEFTPEQSGEYFIEAEEDMREGHKAGFFFSSYYWGDSPTNIKDSGSLELKTDRTKYKPGDKAVVSFPRPEEGTVLITLEKGDRILRSWVNKLKGDEAESRVEVPVTDEMLPNAYVSVSIVQPHAQTGNDRPVRVYGTIPIMVEDPMTCSDIGIFMDDELRSEKDFEIIVRTTDKKRTRFTIAVVDEGLLDLTGFLTPDPWKSFFAKQKLGISTYDLFSYVLSVNKGDIYRLFSIGGEMEAAAAPLYRDSQLDPSRSKRFKAVSMFEGPLTTDGNGEKKIKFTMPDYIGSVRVMVVTADGNRYGKTDKTVPVKTELMVLPTLPRVLGPGDEVRIPVSVFALDAGIKNVNLSIKTEGHLNVIGEKKKKLSFEKPGEQDAYFDLKVDEAVGDCRVMIEAESGRFKASKSVQITIRPSSPRIYGSVKSDAAPGKSIEFTIPANGIKGTNRASLVISRKPKLNLESRLSWLIHYPYGCIEQTVSSVFPQLYLKDFIKDSSIDMDTVDSNINEAIARLRKFSLPSGGLSYWPGNRDASFWGTSYALHFMSEAGKKGYSVPEDLYKSVIRFQKSRSLVTTDHLLERVYRLYTLALAGEPQIGPMNLIVENDLSKLKNVEKWMLSASYFIAGKKDRSEKLRSGINTSVENYQSPGQTFGSSMRDRAMILESLVLFGNWNKADLMYEEIVNELSEENWFSTQTLGYALLALGKYMMANEADFRGDDSPISGYVILPDSGKQAFDFKGLKLTIPVRSGFGKNLKVFVDKSVKLGKVYAALQWNGIPLRSNEADMSKNLELEVNWLNEDGEKIDASLLKQGMTFWGHFRVRPGIYSAAKLTELALVQVIPAGWEIENTRLSDEVRPAWMSSWKPGTEQYTDIRDDRIMWFFDLPGNSEWVDFAVKLNCVSVGKFVLPPTIFEAMYSSNYRAVKRGKPVEVTAR